MDKFAEIDKLAVGFSKLSKKERKKLKRETERGEQQKRAGMAKIVKWSIVIIVVLLALLGGWFLYRELSKPLPGQQVEDLGRDHVAKEKWETFQYNSNPPTSGPHDETWVKAGIYDQPQLEGMLIHSLEHGYVVISYHCDEKVSSIKNLPVRQAHQVFKSVYAHNIEESTSSATASATGRNLLAGEGWGSKECNELKKQLSDLANDKKLWKLIVVSRQNLDSRIAVTAWTRIDKMDEFDRDRIVAFIDAHRNHGPEQTME